MKIVATSGYFNPLHKGHIRLFKEAKALGDFLVVIVNNDKQVELKGGEFMDENERLEIVRSIKYVDLAILSCDSDSTVNESLKILRPDIFAKGGDKNAHNIPEIEMCSHLGIKIISGVGGDKVQSSSWLKK